MRSADLKAQRGHTLIELILVMSLVVMTVVTASTSFTMGTKLFQKIAASTQQEAGMFFLSRLTNDLQNVVVDEERPFTLKPHEIIFATLKDDQAISVPYQYPYARPFQVMYEWDRDTLRVRRVSRDNYFGEVPTQDEVVLEGVTSFKFTSWGEDPGQPKQVTVTFEAQDGVHKRLYKKDILLIRNFITSHD